MSSISPLLFVILMPLVAAVFILIGSNARFTALIASVLNLALTGVLLYLYQTQGDGIGFGFESAFAVIPQLGISFKLGADGFSLLMLLLSTLVTVAAVLVARTPERNANWFYACILFISAGAVGAFSSLDLFFFYMFHELALIPTFIMTGVWGSGDRQTAAWKATIYLAVGSFILLLGLIGLYLIQPAELRTFDLVKIMDMAEADLIPFSGPVYLLLLFGFGILVSLFPFHTWAPRAYASAPSPVAMLHAGVLKKFGLYGLIRICGPILPDEVQAFSGLLLALLVANILYIGYVTISQKRLDWMLGYSSVMHMGTIFLGFAALNIVSLTGASLMLFAHGLSVALLFALCGELRERTGTLEFSELGGLARQMPAFGLAFGFGTMAAVGLPGFIGFASEIMIFFGSFQAGEPLIGNSGGQEIFALNAYQWATVAAVWAVVISAVYMLRAYRHVFLGEMSSRWSNLPDLGFSARVSVISLIVVMLVTGFFPQMLIKLVTPALLWP